MKNFKQTFSYVATLDGWLSSHESFFLYTAAQHTQQGMIVEIGSWMGKSTICLAAGAEIRKKGKVLAIDPHKGVFSKENGTGQKSPTYRRFLKNIKKAGLEEWIIPIVKTSESAAKQWQFTIALLFIDGLHDYKHARQDFSLWSPFVKTGGTIAFHDAFCGHNGPEQVILNQMLSNSQYSDFGVVGSIIYARKKSADSFKEKLNVYRHRVLIPFALNLNKSSLPLFLKFFLIHRIIKLLLLNRYTYTLLLNHL